MMTWDVKKASASLFQVRTLDTIYDFLSLRLKTPTWSPTFSLMTLEVVLKDLLPSTIPGIYKYYHKHVKNLKTKNQKVFTCTDQYVCFSKQHISILLNPNIIAH